MNRPVSITTAALAALVVLTALVVNRDANPYAAAAASGAPPVPAPTTARKIDEYGNIRWRDEKARLDNLAVELRRNPDATGYIICYGGRVGRAGAARRRCQRALTYLITRREDNLSRPRVVMIDGGYRESLMVELWAIPTGADPPAASPTFDPREVKIIGSRAKARSRRR